MCESVACHLRELRSARALRPFALDSAVHRRGYLVLRNEVTFGQFDLTGDTALDGLSASPGGLSTSTRRRCDRDGAPVRVAVCIGVNGAAAVAR